MGEDGLLEYIDENDVVGEIVLLRAANDRSIMIVEGSSDEKLLSYFLLRDQVDIVIAFGRQNALDAMPIVRSRFDGVLCVIDADYDPFFGRDERAPDVIVTSEHDLEMMLACSPALDKLMHEAGSKPKIAAVTMGGRSVREVIQEPTHQLGLLRLYSASKNVNLRFKELRFRFLDRRTLTFELETMVREVFAHSRKAHLSVQEALDFINEWLVRDHDKTSVCCGHDFCTVMGKALQSLLGSQPAAATTAEEVEHKLRLAYSIEDFRTSTLYRDLREWETANSPYRLLAA